MHPFLRRIDEFWFAPAPAARLAVLRVLVGGFSLLYLGPKFSAFRSAVSGPADLYVPVGLSRLLPGPIPAGVYQLLVAAMLVVNVAFVLGWWFRVTGPLFAALITFVLCYRNSWGMIYHTDNLLVLHAVVLGFSRAADVLSLDAILRPDPRLVEEAVNDPEAVEPRGWRYGWPIRLMCAVMVTTYLLAGVAKVAAPLGFGWASGESLRRQVAFDGLRKEFLTGGASELIGPLYQQDALFLMMGALTLVIELGAPVALIRPWVGYVWSLGAFMMHYGVLFIMGISFRYPLWGVAFASFFPVERLVPERLRGIPRRRVRAAL